MNKIERKNDLIKFISNLIPDTRENSKVEHSYYKILRQRVYLMMHDYEDVSDIILSNNNKLSDYIHQKHICNAKDFLIFLQKI